MKNCPICGKKEVPQNEEGPTTCPGCGHFFRPGDPKS
jgi:ribosomal protein L37AE/L43A